MDYVLIGFAASFGALVRWSLAKTFNPNGTIDFSVLAANVMGTFLLGFVLNLDLSDSQKLLLGAGFCGALTTFSTFSYSVFTKLVEKSFMPRCLR